MGSLNYMEICVVYTKYGTAYAKLCTHNWYKCYWFCFKILSLLEVLVSVSDSRSSVCFSRGVCLPL